MTGTRATATAMPPLRLRFCAAAVAVTVAAFAPLTSSSSSSSSTPTSGSGVAYGINPALTNTIVVDQNRVLLPGLVGARVNVATVAELQQLLDAHPNTVVYLRRSQFEVVPDGNTTGLTIRSNRSVVLDDHTTIWCRSTARLPSPGSLPAAEAKYGPHLVMLTGTNVGFKGGHVTDYTVNATGAAVPVTVGVRVFMARDAKLVGVTLRGGWGNAVRVVASDGATSPPFLPCPSYYNVGCQAAQLPFVQGQAYSPALALAEVLLRAQARLPVSLINNTIIGTSVGFRAVWLTWIFGVVATGNTIRGQ